MNNLPKNSGGLGGKSSGLPKNGLAGGPTSAALEQKDPDEFGPSVFAEETNANWQRAGLELSAAMAESWFGSDAFSGTVKERLENLGFAEEFQGLSESFLGESIAESFLSSLESFGDVQVLSESSLAQKILSYLNSRGVSGEEHGVTQISRSFFVNANDLDGSQTALPEWNLSGETSHTWMGPWATGFGSRFLQNLRVFKSETGVETALWFANAVIGSRPPLLEEGGYLGPSEVFRREILLPTLAKRLFYLAETPFPSSLMTFGRNLAYQDLEEDKWPRPFYSIGDFELTVCTIEDPSRGPVANFHIFPQVVNFGWAFDASESEDLELIIPSVVDAMSRLMSILEDGFRNHPAVDSPFSWSDFFGPLALGGDERPRFASCRWIPATQVGALVKVTNELNDRGHTDNTNSASDFRWIAENGAGISVSSAINSLVYGHLLPEGKYERSRELLEVAIGLDHLNESTNALSNLAQVYLAEGKVELAKETFLSALDRADNYSEGEASLLLGDLFSLQNDAIAAKSYFERASDSGHEPFASMAQSRLHGESLSTQPESTAEASPTSSPQHRFCTNCGLRFTKLSQKFCESCGSAL